MYKLDLKSVWRKKVNLEDFKKRKEKIAVVGLGYVGMPLLAHLSRHFDTIGFDVNKQRIEELKAGIDKTNELRAEDFKDNNIVFSSDPKSLQDAGLIIVAVPTPIDEHKLPDLTPVIEATKTVAHNIKKGGCVVYESTVYPTTTEDICVPIIEEITGFKYCKDFFVGYSPERINPGDRVHTVDKITKIVSGCNKKTAELLAGIYGAINNNNIFKAENIKTAEAAKVIENTQRDLNIALMNELSMIFEKLDIDTKSVLEAAKTKWNFLPFEPGLVGGHCIGVDPYYLTYKAQELGYHPEIILAGRRINDSVGEYIVKQTVKKIIKSGRVVLGANALVLGITFKENVGDIRNSKVVDVVRELEEFGVLVDIYDPLADINEVKETYGLNLKKKEELSKQYGCVILAVKHKEFLQNPGSVVGFVEKNGVLIDIKSVFDKNSIRKDITYWRP